MIKIFGVGRGKRAEDSSCKFGYMDPLFGRPEDSDMGQESKEDDAEASLQRMFGSPG